MQSTARNEAFGDEDDIDVSGVTYSDAQFEVASLEQIEINQDELANLLNTLYVIGSDEWIELTSKLFEAMQTRAKDQAQEDAIEHYVNIGRFER